MLLLTQDTARNQNVGDNTLFPKAPVMFELDKEEDDLYAVLNGKTFAMLDDEEKKYFNQFDVHVQLILENTPLEKGG